MEKVSLATSTLKFIAKFISTHLKKSETINTERSSYALKHLVSKAMGNLYMNNADFIQAMIIAGFEKQKIKGKTVDGGYNYSFNVDEESIVNLSKS